MRLVVLNTDYPDFLCSLYARNPGLEKQSYAKQLEARNDTLFGVADFYSSNLRKLGHEAYDIHANNKPMQKAWAREHGISIGPDRSWSFRLRRGFVPWFGPVRDREWFCKILSAQIRHYKPDVLLNQDMAGIPCAFLKGIKQHVLCLVGQHAATPLPDDEWTVYDLVISSFPPTIGWLRNRGVAAWLNRLAFEPRVLELGHRAAERTIPVSFIGSFFPVHSSRTAILEQIAENLPLKVWGCTNGHDLNGSPLATCYEGQAWGIDMYRILASSRITVNHHGDVPPYANNMRLYEATGMGTLLITDWKKNLHEIFEPDKEVVAYRTPQECVELIRYYLDHEEERARIAKAGQERTLREHTYYHRMQELVQIAQKHLQAGLACHFDPSLAN